jgi:hypothetical protein
MERIAELDPEGEWYLLDRPFRHVRAEMVFRKKTYDALVEAFVSLKEREGCDQSETARFSKRQPGYDAEMLAVDQEVASFFSPLFERRWTRFLGGLLGLPDRAQIDGGLHHIPVDSRSGWVHNDFCSAWFDEGTTGDIIFPDRRKCDYFSGTLKSADARPREYIRAATMIFYLQNDDWQKGCGGETGLYTASAPDLGACSTVPPLSNSLLLFECSPHSYHRLLANPGCPRRSVIMWLHDTVQDTQSRWGDGATRRKPK